MTRVFNLSGNAFRLYRGLLKKALKPAPGGVWVIGNFDGVHNGHKALIKKAAEYAETLGTLSGCLTFEPHPREFFSPAAPPFRLTRPSDKFKQLAQAGADACVALRFDAGLANLSAEAFVSDILVAGLGAAHIVIGHDFHFGKDRGGNPEFLRQAGEKYGFKLTIAEPHCDENGVRLSSKYLRDLVREGDMQAYFNATGRFYALAGRVRRGAARGREIGFPTANLNFYPRLLPPRNGVYAVTVEGAAPTPLKAIANFGFKPTVGGVNDPLLEIHIPNFSGDLYDKKLFVTFTRFIRPEKKFSGLDALKAQIEEDVKRV